MRKLISLTFSLALLFGACSSDKTGNFRLYLTDKPIVDAEKILVNISEIRVQKTGEAFLTIWQGRQTFDLLALKAKEQKIVDIQLEEGDYTQIRLIVDSGSIIVNGQNYGMEVPSSEVKIPVVFSISEAGATEIVLDFDAENSIEVVHNGGGDSYILRPVIIVKSISY